MAGTEAQPEKQLTSAPKCAIMMPVTVDEQRILLNLRRVAEELFHNGDIHAAIKVHKDALKHGYIQLGDSVIRL
jgi:hypothetical protein